MQDIISVLPALAGLVEKGGIIGIMLIACGVLSWEVNRLRKRDAERTREIAAIYAQRDRWRLAYVKCKAALDQAKIVVDLSDISDLIANNEGEHT